MAVTINKTSDVSVEICIAVQEADYQDKLNKALKTCQRTVDMKGFRPGKAPMSLVLKKYGVSIKIDTLNKYVAELLGDTLEKEKFEYLGQPMLKDDLNIDLENGKDFEFIYELALRPELNIKLTKKDKLPYYNIEATDDIVDEQIKNMLDQYGSQISVEDIKERDIVKGDLLELDADGCVKSEGISLEEAMIMPAYVKDSEIQKSFLNAKLGDTLNFSVFQAYVGNEAEIAALLKIEKENVANYKDVNFQYVVKNISRHQAAELNDEFFKKAFGEESDVKDEASLKAKVVESLNAQFKPESDMKLYYDIADLVKSKGAKIEYPEELLKKFVLEQDKEMTAEKFDAEKEAMFSATTVSLFKDEVLKSADVKISEEEVQAMAIDVARSQFLQYGMNSLPAEMLENYAKSMLEKDDFKNNIIDRLMNDKFTTIIKEKVTLEEKNVTPEEFGKLINPDTEA